MKNLKFLALFFTATLVLVSCSSDDDGNEPINEEEVITTVRVALTGGSSPINLEWKQLDESAAPTITVSGTLDPNTTYTGVITVLNELENPADNITEEIEEEADEHQFFFLTGGGITISNLTYLDFDGDGNPLGLLFSFDTGEASLGDFTIILRHEPNKDADGVSEGNIANAGGDTDIEITFPLEIQ
ncbi:MAG: type 1 periplasmic binding fold superfamily protein [Flavobacteriaceae bacterium]|nr:type 1 periplasmic binding fold superfamily protein [Flavobacteriaceae bacterium]